MIFIIISNFCVSGGKGRGSVLAVGDDEHQGECKRIGPGMMAGFGNYIIEVLRFRKRGSGSRLA